MRGEEGADGESEEHYGGGDDGLKGWLKWLFRGLFGREYLEEVEGSVTSAEPHTWGDGVEG